MLALLCLPACTWFRSGQPVLVTSDPPGARIFLDGADTGRHTPTTLDIANLFGGDHWLLLTKPGHRAERRLLSGHTIGYTSRWIDGGSDPSLPPLPIFWTAGDFFFPFGVRSAIVPGELYVKLYRDDEPLLGFDALAAQAGRGPDAERRDEPSGTADGAPSTTTAPPAKGTDGTAPTPRSPR